MSDWFDSKKLHDGLNALGIPLLPTQEDALRMYGDSIIEINRHMNLTRVPEDEFISRHFLDSLSIASAIDLKSIKNLIDIGTGAGFPGVPIAIVWPHIEVTVLDSTKKKISFVVDTASKIGVKLSGVHARAEELSHDPNYREKFDVATFRALSALKVAIEISSGLVKVGGKIVAWKGEKALEEIEQAEPIREDLMLSVPVRIPGPILKDTSLIVYEKVGPLKAKFPRRYSELRAEAKVS